MGFWGAFGRLFTLFFAPPIIFLDSLWNEAWRYHYTVKNVCFGLFWTAVFSVATSYGVWSRLWEELLLDAQEFCKCTPWACDSVWALLVLAGVIASSGLTYMSTKLPTCLESIRKTIVGFTTFYLKSAYDIKIIARLVDILPVFIRQLSMNYFLYRTRDDDGEIMVIAGPEEKPEKKPKTKVGVPKSVRIKQKQAIESAQAVNHPNGSANGSIEKARRQVHLPNGNGSASGSLGKAGMAARKK